MKRGFPVLLVVIALLVGLVAGYAIGFGVWGVKVSQIAHIQAELRQMTKDVLDLKSNLPVPAAPRA